MKIELQYTKSFLKSGKGLPVAQQKKLAELLGLMCENPYNALLHTKPLSGQLAGFYSFRITREWRVIFQFLSPATIKLVDVAHRKDIYR